MIDILGIKQQIEGLKELKNPDDRLQTARTILQKVVAAERQIAADFSVPFDTVRELKNIIPDIQAIVGRLEAGLKRRQEKEG